MNVFANRRLLTITTALALIGAGGCEPPDSAVLAAGDKGVGASAVCLNSMYGNDPQIDPDNPVYSDASVDQATVTQLFASAAATNSKAYRAYRAAFENPVVLKCAFCDCGCNASVGHTSAVDCFKDMHGFY